jgi:hypothetical protein
MARVKLMAGIERISGTIGNVTFYTRNGKTFMTKRSEPELPKNATRKQRAQHKKRTIVNACVELVQVQMDDMLEAIEKRKKIRDRMCYLYEKLSPEIKAKTKLQKAIMTAYYEGENGSEMHRENIGNGSAK